LRADFYDWNPYAHSLRRRSNGTREVVTVPASAAPHFRYLAKSVRGSTMKSLKT
jgi:hypothetical protein